MCTSQVTKEDAGTSSISAAKYMWPALRRDIPIVHFYMDNFL